MTGAKKVIKVKNQFFCACQPRAKEFLKFGHTEALFSQLILHTLTSYFQVLKHFSKIFFGSNHYKYLEL